MRFNDLLRTVLANMGDGTVATVTRWRQCIDLLAQYDVSGADALHAGDRDAILRQLEAMRPQLSVAQRVASVVELGGRLRSPGLVRLLAQDHPTLVVAMMAGVTLADADWVAVIPDLGPLARSVLRRREDLGPGAVAALQRFGSVDLSLTSLVPPPVEGSASAATPPPANDGGETQLQSQISRIMAQIDRFTETRQQRRAPAPGGAPATPPRGAQRQGPVAAPLPSLIRCFTFETDAAGVIQLIAGAPRAAAMGLSIGHPASDSRYGADGLALGAFRRRAAFEKARFAIGEGMLAGEWRMSATPRFDPATGRFLCYTGSARRERPDESLVRAGSDAPDFAGLSAAATRELVHELRTPLNAIHGYAEMIEAQLVGPVPSEYRDMARQILIDARALVETFDDLDLASRIEHGDGHGAPERIDIAALMRALANGFEPDGHARISIAADRDLPLIACDRVQLERMLAHLIRAGYGALAEGERLAIMLAPGTTSQSVEIMMRRPAALGGLSEQALLDQGDELDRTLNPAPPLGLAFTLKLVRGIAAHLGGRFLMTPHSFALTLPAAAATPGRQGNAP
ncbi:MAG TPA: histidine kinase dimerization/phospho-acceptor domain-containing protein [Sphingobium sp.]|nr:histidine kinase dimerization/phospho-acceptor domain-containing protein [Sphingobium sp.]